MGHQPTLIQKIKAYAREIGGDEGKGLANFADNLEVAKRSSMSPAEFMKASPWAWFRGELAKIGILVPQHSGVSTTTMRKVIESDEIGFERGGQMMYVFERSPTINQMRFRAEGLVFLEGGTAQAVSRFLIEMYGLPSERQKNWFRVLIYLASIYPEGATMQEIEKGINGTIDYADFKSSGIRILRNNVRRAERKTAEGEQKNGSSADLFYVTPNFYNIYYLPLKPWLTPEGLKLFKAWKQEFHFEKK